jgi:hypothetical protein
MILVRDGNVLLGNAWVPEYHVVTWSWFDETKESLMDQNIPDCGVLASWTAPMDERRFVIPGWVQTRAAAAEVHIRS